MSASGTRFAVLIFTDIVGASELKVRHGVPAFSEALVTHNGHFERLARECGDIRILQNMGDGYFAEAGGIVEALRFALLFQDAMRDGPWTEVRLATRVGIHAGEVSVIPTEGGGIVAPAADLAARVMSLALGGQILLTRVAFDEARHFIREHPVVAGKKLPPLHWLAHGPYLMKGRDEPVEIFEVGAEELAPLVAPPDAEKAKRAIRPGEEETLGWRPAVGLEIPGRTGWYLTELLGTGGFGEVWAGEHAKLHQRRAFKFCFDDERLRALKREVTLVRLLGSALGERDDIVRIHELKLDSPPFYLESDLAPHGNLLQWAEKQGGLASIPLDRRIGLVAHTAAALAAAHSIGVLHKDIKPTNVLIFDGPGGEPRPRLVDFGIGALADPGVLRQHGVTAAGFTRATIEHSTGTPTYSPPEYLAGRPYTIQGDIYGLGVLLYQLVTAKPLDPLATGWERDIADPLLREDIAACVDGDPARRLASAADLAERLLDLDQRRAEIAEKEHLDRAEAARAEAEAATIAVRLRAARFRKLAAAFAVLALLALAGGVLAWMNQRKAVMALAEVKETKVEVDRKNSEYRAMLTEAARSDRLVAVEKLQAGLEREAFAHLARACEYDPDRSSLAAEKVAVALNTWQHLLPAVIIGGNACRSNRGWFSSDGSHIVTISTDGKAVRVWDAATGNCVAILAGYEGSVHTAEFSPDGTLIITASNSNTARVWDALTGKSLATLSGHEKSVAKVRFSQDGSRIVTTSDDKTARVWDAASGKCLAILAEREALYLNAEISPDGTRIVTGTSETARLWDGETGKCIATLIHHGGFSWHPQFSPDGTRILTASSDNTARLSDAATGQHLATIGSDNQMEPAFGGSRIVTTLNSTARIWDTTTGKCLATLGAERDPVENAQFSPDGARVVTTSMGNTAKVWNAESGACLVVLAGHGGRILTANYSPDGTRIVTISMDGIARVWDATTGKCLAILAGHRNVVLDTRFSLDGGRILTLGYDNTVIVWNWDDPTSASTTTLAGHETHATIIGSSPDGTRFVTASTDNTAGIWDAATGKCLIILSGHKGAVLSVQFSLDGTRVVTTSNDKTARVWDTTTGKCLAILEGFPSGNAWFVLGNKRIFVSSGDRAAAIWNCENPTVANFANLEKDEIGYDMRRLTISPDGARVVDLVDGHEAVLWDVVTGKRIVEFTGHGSWLLSAQFSPDGTRIVTTAKNSAWVWNAVTGEKLATLAGHKDYPDNAQFSPDGMRIVTASRDCTARVWDATTGRCLVILSGHKGEVLRARFSLDGARVVTISKDNTARVWDATTGKNLAILTGQKEALGSAQFSPDGTRIITSSYERTTRMWDFLDPNSGPAPTWFPDFIRYLAQMRLNSEGEMEPLLQDDWLALRERMREVKRASKGQDTPYLRILRRYVAE